MNVQHGVDLELLTNLCGRHVKPNPDQLADWPWEKKHRVEEEKPRDPLVAFIHLSKYNDSILAERAEVVAVYKTRRVVKLPFGHRTDCVVMLKIANDAGEIRSIHCGCVLLVKSGGQA